MAIAGAPRRPRRWGRWVLLAAGIALLLLALDGFLAIRKLSSDLQGARDALEEAAEQLEKGDVPRARASFQEALRATRSASGAVDRPALRVAGGLPWIADDVEAVRVLTEATTLAAGAGARIADAAAAAGWDGTSVPGLQPGRIDLDVFAAATPALAEASDLLRRARALLEPLHPQGKLEPIAEAVTEAKEAVGERVRQAERAAAVAELLPGLLGAEGDRTYAIVMMTLADPRGSGGYPGSYGVLGVSDGTLDLETLAPTGDLGSVPPVEAPQDVVRRYQRFGGLTHFISSTYSPDWPTSASIWMRMWEASGREPLDGVIGIDSVGMSYLLGAMGSVETPVWPRAITADNVSEIVDSETMLTLDKTQSDRWQLAIAESFWKAMVSRPLPADGFAGALSRATAERHLQVFAADPAAQSILDELGASGRLEMPENPLAVSWSGFSGSRTGFFAEKSIDYRAVLGPDGTADVTITVAVTNRAPTGPESILLGLETDNFDVGEYAAAASVYLPAEASRIRSRVDGGGSLVKLFEREFDRRVVLTVLLAEAGQTTTAEISYVMPASADGFDLGIVPQPELRPTPVSVEIEFPAGTVADSPTPGVRVAGSTVTYEAVAVTPVWIRTTSEPR